MDFSNRSCGELSMKSSDNKMRIAGLVQGWQESSEKKQSKGQQEVTKGNNRGASEISKAWNQQESQWKTTLAGSYSHSSLIFPASYRNNS